MKIGIAGPILTALLREELGPEWSSLPPGAGGYPVVTLIKHLVAAGYRVAVFTLDSTIPGAVSFVHGQLEVYYCPLRKRRTGADLFRRETRALKAAMRESMPDVIHAHWTEYGLAAVESGIPTMYTVHEAHWNIVRYAPTSGNILRALLAYRLLPKANSVAVPSEHVKAHLRRYYRYRGDVHVIDNPVDDHLFSGEPGKTLDPRAPVYASIASGFCAYKNTRTLIQAFQIVRRRLPDASLLLYGGDHEQGGPAWVWARAHGLEENIVFAGLVPHTVLWRQLRDRADVIVHPALEESFSNVLAEAMAAGFPIIANQTGGAVPTTVAGAGLLIDTRSKEELATAMVRVAADGALRKRLAGAGPPAADARFRAAMIARRHLELLRTLPARSFAASQ